MTQPDEAVHLKTGRLIVAAMTAGLLVFAGVVSVLDRSDAGGGASSGTWMVILLGFAVANVIAATFVHTLFVGKARARVASGDGDRSVLVGDFLGLTILRGALIEATGLFACIAYMIGSAQQAIWVALACAAVLLAVVFPTEERFRSFEERVRRPE